jgi:hypothetical protein
MTAPALIYPDLDLPAAFKRLDSYVARYNELARAARAAEHDRAKRATLPQPLRSGHKLCAQRLLRHFGGHLVHLRARARNPLTKFCVTRQGLATSMNCDLVTVDNRVARLIEAGIILHRINRGRRYGAHYILRPSLLVARCLAPTQANLEALGIGEGSSPTDLRSALDRLRPSLAPFTAAALPYSDKIEKFSQVEDGYLNETEKKEGHCGFASPAGVPPALVEPSLASQTKHQEADEPLSTRHNGSQPASAPMQDESTGRRAPQSTDGRAAPHAIEPSPAALVAAARAWHYAQRLWPGRRFDAGTGALVLPILARWVDRGKAPNAAQCEIILREFTERIDLAAAWVAADPARWAADPLYYFDATNPNGFARTLVWHKNARRAARRIAETKANCTWLATAFERLCTEPLTATRARLLEQARSRPHAPELTRLVNALAQLVAETAFTDTRDTARKERFRSIVSGYRQSAYPSRRAATPDQLAQFTAAQAGARAQAQHADAAQAGRARTAARRSATGTTTLATLL